MLRKLSVVITLFAFSCIAALAQDAPPKAPAAPKSPAKTMVYSFGGNLDGGYLGVQIREVSKDNFNQYGLSEVRGVAVESVVDDSPAAKAGLRAGDVIVRFEGQEVTSVRKLNRMVSEVAPDHKVRLTVVRNGGEIELTAVMGRREAPTFSESGVLFGDVPFPVIPEIPAAPTVPAVPKIPRGGSGENVFFFGSNRVIGVSVSSLTEQLGDYFGAPDGKGVLINSVVKDSPAAKAGLRAGDVIVEVDGKTIENAADLTRQINAKKEGAVTLTILRNKSRQTFSVEPKKSEGMGLLPGFEGNKLKLNPKTVFAPGSVIGIAAGRIL